MGELCLLSPGCRAEWRVFGLSQASGLCWLPCGAEREFFFSSCDRYQGLAFCSSSLSPLFFPQKHWLLAAARDVPELLLGLKPEVPG